MELYIAGGVGEHGRNCFFVTYEKLSFLVDCGIMAGAEEPYPDLDDDMIRSAEYLFLTHSHADHCGALAWLYSKGFDGTVIASAPTFSQMKFTPMKKLCLEEVFSNRNGCLNGLNILWGRSGHCMGSVWYRFENNGSSILFSGDYTENTFIYRCDKIRELSAGKAVIDCAYGSDKTGYPEYCGALTERTLQLLKKYPLLVFPVPKYGRGEEILALFSANGIDTEYYGDEHFIKQLSDSAPFWKKSSSAVPNVRSDLNAEKGIYFISSPQLNTSETAQLAEKLISNGGYAVFTGTIESGCLSEKLIKTGHGEFIRYPVHQGINECSELCKKNHFESVIAYHTKENISVQN